MIKMNNKSTQRIDIDGFNREVPIVDLAEALGMEPVKSGSYFTAHCKVCQDEGRKRHLTFYPAKNICVCHKCNQVRGNNFSLIKYHLGTDNKGAVEWIRQRYGSHYTLLSETRLPPAPKAKPQPQPFDPVAGKTDLHFRIYRDLYYLLDLPYKVGWYMTFDRAIKQSTLDKFGARGLYRNHQTIESELRRRYGIDDLIEAGIYYRNAENKPQFRFFDDCVIFPLFYRGNIIGLSSRNLPNPKHPDRPKSYRLPGKAYFNLEALYNYDIIYVYEGIINGLSHYELTQKDNFIATLGLISESDYRSLTSTYPNILFRFCYDPDPAGQGRNAMFKAEPEFYSRLFKRFGFDKIPTRSVVTDKGELKEVEWDINELLVLIRDDFEYRASILEYCQGNTREEAEANAEREILTTPRTLSWIPQTIP